MNSICLTGVQTSSTSDSPTAKLLRYIERKYPTQDQQAFHVDNRLFSDTSSQLPGSDATQRTFNHVLITSHDEARAYTRTTAPGDTNQGATVTLPISAVEPLVGLLHGKLQALWYPRHALHVTDGVSVLLMDGRVKLSFGDLRTSRGFPGAGSSRGTLVEVSVEQYDDTYQDGDVDSSPLFRDVLRKLLPNIELDFSETEFVASQTQALSETKDQAVPNAPDYDLAKLYMDFFRGLR